MAWSLRAALDAVPAGAAGVVIALADDPLALGDLPAVLDAAAIDPSRPVLVDRPTAPHPVWAPAAAIASFRPDPEHPDRGLGPALRALGPVLVPATSPSIDVDTAEDLAALERHLHDAPA
jgi:CTP:molybdopterin cytidylyltransferase MocA